MRARNLLIMILYVILAWSGLAFDVRNAESTLQSKTKAFSPLAIGYDAQAAEAWLQTAEWQHWNQLHGGNWTAQFDTRTGVPRRVWGGAIPWVPGEANDLTGPSDDATLEQVARTFISDNPELFATTNDHLRFDPSVASPDREGRIRYAAFDYVVDGVPVEYGRLTFAVNNGNMIYWHSANISDAATQTTPVLSADQAIDALLGWTEVPSSAATLISGPTLKLIPQNSLTADGGLRYVLTWEILLRLDGGIETWAGYVDGATGAILAFSDANRYAGCPEASSPSGKVTGGIRPAKATDEEVVRSFPFTSVDDGSVTTLNGNFAYTPGATSSTELSGRFFDANCSDCVRSESDPVSGWQPFATSDTGRIELGTGGRDVVQGPGEPTISYGNGTSTPADRTAFYHTNVARSIAQKWVDFDFLDTTVPVNVNINDICNAYWGSSSLNFFKSGEYISSSSGELIYCSNTGEIRDVMQHEWGHGVDANDGLPPGYAAGVGDFATGEAVGDHIALFVDHDACIGQSFMTPRDMGLYVTDLDTMELASCNGVRDLDELRSNRGTLSITNVETQCPGPPISTSTPQVILYFGPMLREGHCEGEIWGQAAFHLVESMSRGRQYGTVTLDGEKRYATYEGDPLPDGADGSPNPAIDRDQAWMIHERLFFLSRPLVASYAPSRHQAMGGSAYDGYLVVDDEGDGLANGTPHAAYINDAMVHHGMEEWGLPGGVPAGIDSANCDTLATPNVTLSPGIAGDGTPAVTVSWTEVAGASSYAILRNERRDDVFLEVGRVDASTLSFTDVGVDNGVSYNYRVQANADTPCYSVSSGGVRQVSLSLPEPAVKSMNLTDSPQGNGDGGLDSGERAQLYIVLTNRGVVGLNHAEATLSSLSSGVRVLKDGPYSYGSLAVGESAGPSRSFVVELDPNGMLCGSVATFALQVSSDEGCFTLLITIPIGNDGTSCAVFRDVYAQPATMAIASDGAGACSDGDAVPDPGETIEVTVQVNNVGERSAKNVAVTLSADRSYATFDGPSTLNLGTIEPLGAETKSATFLVSIDSTAPFDDRLTLTASVTASGQQEPAASSIVSAVNRDEVKRTETYDFESGAQGWTSSDPAAGWVRENLQAQTGNLTYLWHAQYTADRCDTLVSPEYEISDTSTLSWDLAYVSENTDAAWDGMDVQISADGGLSWVKLEPQSGYPALSVGSGCVPVDTGYYSGYQPLMSRQSLDLSPWNGMRVQIRFRWATDELVDAIVGGAWIDNIEAADMTVAVPDTPCLP